MASSPGRGSFGPIQQLNIEDKTGQQKSRHGKKEQSTTGASAAGARAALARVVAFYFRAPAKAFFRTRVDWTGYARAINPRIQANKNWSLHTTTPGILGHAIRTHGFRFLPDYVLVPLAANVAIGTVLYTTYLKTLGRFQGQSYETLTRVYPPPSFKVTFAAGGVAGLAQAVFAAPFDALQARFSASLLIDGKYKNMWLYGRHKLREIGPRGVCAGLSLSLVKDGLGFALFFSTFEYVKAQCFYSFLTNYYGGLSGHIESSNLRRGPDSKSGVPTIRPHFALEPSFLLLAGISATITQQLVQYPLTIVQDVHLKRLESIDREARLKPPIARQLQLYGQAYRKTLRKCSERARRAGGWPRWLYGGFWMNTIRQTPSTSAGLIIFEIVRRMYAEGVGARIEKDGYDILLP